MVCISQNACLAPYVSKGAGRLQQVCWVLLQRFGFSAWGSLLRHVDHRGGAKETNHVSHLRRVLLRQTAVEHRGENDESAPVVYFRCVGGRWYGSHQILGELVPGWRRSGLPAGKLQALRVSAARQAKMPKKYRIPKKGEVSTYQGRTL